MTRATPALVLALAYPAVGTAQGLTIDHKKVDCVVAGKHPRMAACFAPSSQLARGRVYFRPQDVSSWYYVEMKSAALCHEGVLPKPSRKLVGTQVVYYVEAADKSYSVGRTDDFTTTVVRTAEECKNRVVAPFVGRASVAVSPVVPPGFTAVAGPPTAALIGGGIAAPWAGGWPPSSSRPGVTTTSRRPRQRPRPRRRPRPFLPRRCPRPRPRRPRSASPWRAPPTPAAGRHPCEWTSRPSLPGGTGVYEFLWTFGDGGRSAQVSPVYVYNTPGEFLAAVEVTSGGRVARCERSHLGNAGAADHYATRLQRHCHRDDEWHRQRHRHQQSRGHQLRAFSL